MEKDFAVVIGLQDYPGIDAQQPALCGSENDAKEFRNWLLSADGGAVPAANVTTILSADYGPPFPSASDAKPIFNDIFRALNRLRDMHLANVAGWKDPRVGRRLYLFMSGHGIAPTPYGAKITRESALLTADVDPLNVAAPQYNVPGVYTANWFCENDCFEEVFLFMDCCRGSEIAPSSNIFFPAKGTADTAKRFYAFGTKWARNARERADAAGKTMGVFTRTLLCGLSGAAADPDSADPEKGVITGASLKSFLYQNMKEFMDPLILMKESSEPDVDYAPKAMEGRDIVITSGIALKKFPVKITVPAGATGALKVYYNGTRLVYSGPVATLPGVLSVNLPRGTYLANVAVNGSAEMTPPFVVKGVEEAGRETTVSFTV